MKKTKTMLTQRQSRKEAIADGALIDVTATAREAGIRYPTALTRQAWDICVKVPPNAYGYSETGTLWGVLQKLRTAAQEAKPKETRLSFTVWVYDGEEAQPCRLRAVCGPGDDLEPVITVMHCTEQ